MTSLSQAQLDRVAGLPSREAASILGVGKTTINDYRRIARENGGKLPLGNGSLGHKVVHEGGMESTRFETDGSGGIDLETQSETPQTKADIDAAMIKRGFDPEEFDFTYRFSEWQAQRAGGEIVTMYAARAAATPKRVRLAELDVDELIERVDKWDFTVLVTDSFAPVDYVQLFADPQFGKTDMHGGSAETVEQIMNSYEAAVAIAQTERPHEIAFVDLGDGLENFQNTSSQRETNDLDLTAQVRLLRRMQAEGLRMLRPYCKRLTHISVPSNHGQVRIAPQQQASTASNDWGLEVSHQLQDAFEMAGSDISFVRPKGKHDVSVSHRMTCGTNLGATHGDTAGTQQRVATWWQQQAFGWDNPLRDVDILCVGHFHNQATEEVFEGRHLIFGASSDRGSAWFTNRTGRSASSGMTTFLTANGTFGDIRLV